MILKFIALNVSFFSCSAFFFFLVKTRQRLLFESLIVIVECIVKANYHSYYYSDQIHNLFNSFIVALIISCLNPTWHTFFCLSFCILFLLRSCFQKNYYNCGFSCKKKGLQLNVQLLCLYSKNEVKIKS